MPGSADKLKAELNKFIEDSIEQAGEIKKQAAREAFKSVVAKSPVKTGSYVLSHRIGIKATKTATGEPNLKRGAPFKATYKNQGEDFTGMTKIQFAAVKQAALKRMSKINRAKPLHEIIIANNIHYADKVEYLGWERTGPYHVYGNTIAELQVKLPFMVKSKLVGKTGLI
jgi:hypothetical protein